MMREWSYVKRNVANLAELMMTAVGRGWLHGEGLQFGLALYRVRPLLSRYPRSSFANSSLSPSLVLASRPCAYVVL
jgi:hypothetical protein